MSRILLRKQVVWTVVHYFFSKCSSLPKIEQTDNTRSTEANMSKKKVEY